MEQQYDRLPMADADIETERNDGYFSHEYCEKCRSGARTSNMYVRFWHVFVAVSFWLVVVATMCIWLRQHTASLQTVVPQTVTSRLKTNLFMPDERFNPGNQTKDSDDAWAEMHSRFVMIENAHHYGLPSSIDGKVEGSRVYAVAAFHQLHCMRIIRGAWYAVIKDGPGILDGPVDLPGHPAYKALAGHVAHCFDYIRQAIMCAGDPSLEAFLESDGVTLRPQGSSGWGVRHKCVDWDALVRWTEDHKDSGP